MSVAAPARPARRGAAVALLVGVIAVAVLLVLPGGKSSGDDDPTSTTSGGAKALALLIDRLGGVVDTSGSLPAAGQGVALVLQDRLTSAGRSRVEAWVRSGGTLVIADPSSTLADVSPAEGPTPDSEVGGSGEVAPDCGAAWVDGVDEIDVDDVAFLNPPAGAVARCFGASDGDDVGYFAVERADGAGSVVVLAGSGLWTNGELGHDANSVLAANLLVPAPGARVAWLTGAVGGGRETLLDAVPAPVDELFVGIGVAVLLLVGWKARRLGRPVEEEVPVVIPGSELVSATGRLLARHGHRDRAADLLREGLISELATELSVPLEPEHTDVPAALVRAVAERTGRDPAAVAALLDRRTPPDDAALVDLADALNHLRREVARVPQ